MDSTFRTSSFQFTSGLTSCSWTFLGLPLLRGSLPRMSSSTGIPRRAALDAARLSLRRSFKSRFLAMKAGSSFISSRFRFASRLWCFTEHLCEQNFWWSYSKTNSFPHSGHLDTVPAGRLASSCWNGESMVWTIDLVGNEFDIVSPGFPPGRLFVVFSPTDGKSSQPPSNGTRTESTLVDEPSPDGLYPSLKFSKRPLTGPSSRSNRSRTRS